jgi:Tfp pilus assembly protein PilV
MIDGYNIPKDNLPGGQIREISSEEGFSLIEVLVAMIFAGIVSISITSSVLLALRTEKNTEVHFAASVLASDKMEQLLSIDALNLDASYNENDTNVQWADMNFNFLRTTNVVVNADDSRTVTVQIKTDNDSFPVNVSFTSTMALWE